MLSPFANEPFTNFGLEQNAAKMRDALGQVQSQLGREYPLIIGGEKFTTSDRLASVNPSNPEEVIGTVNRATQELADKALAAATTAFKSWRHVQPEARARYAFKIAAELRRRKFEFASWMVYEVGKSWPEADGDVAEAIDFCEFYGREALRYAQSIPLTPYSGEQNEAFYIPLGVGIVIPPWNFPLAIMVGMTVAAIVTGNTVILKPSSDSPIIAAKFVELLESISLPAGVVNYLPASGGRLGDYLVQHPKTRFVSFTGSKEVGLRINELAAQTSEGQIWIKRVVAEMGGKDTIVVDKEADIDAAVDGIVGSAYGFSGQKCSACSRAVIVEDVYDEIVSKVAEKTKKLKVGPVTDPGNFTGPVASKQAYESILSYIEIGKREGRLVAGGEKATEAGPGYFIKPTVIADVDPMARISQEEIFGPVLAMIKAKNFDDAIDIANNTIYGLTGAVYSTNRQHLEQARQDFHVGNLYFNRKCTGALVDVHPFGGFNMSGTDSKAGGKDYLGLFLQMKSVSEKL